MQSVKQENIKTEDLEFWKERMTSWNSWTRIM